MYLDKARASFDIDAINNSDFNWGYDAMYGAGREAVPALLPKLRYCIVLTIQF